MKYHRQIDGEWVEFAKQFKIACCDCGLVHRMTVRVLKGKPQIQAFRDARATGQTRRHMKNQYKVSVPDQLIADLQRATRKPSR